MTTLDYAALYETEFRHRRRRVVWLRIPMSFRVSPCVLSLSPPLSLLFS